MTRSRLIALAAVALLAVVGCGNASSPQQTEAANVASANVIQGGSCLETKNGTCTDYNDKMSGFAERNCKEARHGTYSKEACPTANLMGTCVRIRDRRYYYFGGALPLVSDAVQACEKEELERGTFVPQPGAIAAAKANALPSPTRITASCTNASKSCEDVWGEIPESYKTTCEQFGGAFTTKPCGTEKLVGSCVKNGKVTRFYEKDLRLQTLNELEEECDVLARPFGHFYRNPSYRAAAPPSPKHSKKAKR